ncbi:MAG TPA: phosphate ABC transporter substrate-binding protein PstS [Pseudacidobacterium sp.]|jgi:phosphate ABC transporter phosphate-binding protein|nr:phosphate ABC transporter substrate-binding protein PstS [Pseudacidobacterium sp.]
MQKSPPACLRALTTAFVLLLLFHGITIAQTIRTVFVAPLTGGSGASAIQKRLKDHLEKSGFHVVDNAKAADAVLNGNAVIWPTGTITNDPRSNSLRQTIYQGYLSVELVNAENQALWSYLVTPSHFRTSNIVDDLADRLSQKLIEAIKSGISASVAGASPGKSDGPALRAAGSTFTAPLYMKWFESFHQTPGGVIISYNAVGSEAGIEQLLSGKADIAASDIPDTPPDTLHFPVVAGGVVPIYNLPDLTHGLHLTQEVLAGIYFGTIKKWNDPRIEEWNKGTHLPDVEITVVHRSDGSGTTYVWTSYLAQASPEWNAKAGARVDWPVGIGATGNEGEAEQVAKTPNSIGYVELIYAIQHQLNYAAVRNASGRFIKADLASITAAAAGHNAEPSILNVPGRDAYPISSFTWVVIPKAGTDPEKRKAIATFLRWMLTDGQKDCSSLGYVPLPRDVAANELHVVDTLK